MEKSKNYRHAILVIALFSLGIAFRFALLPVISGDMKFYLLPWYRYIAANGIWASLGDEFSNYTPPYLYLLSLATLTRDILPRIIAIKSISIIFDLINAYLIYRLVKLHVQDSKRAILASGLFLCLPTIAMNSAAWGQADAIFTSFILLCIFYLLQDKPLLAVIAFSVAFTFKAQAIFLSPLLLLLTLRKHIPWRYYLIVPIIYLVMILPTLAAGRSMMSTLSVYLGQAGTYRSLAMKAPNPYLFISNELYVPVVYIGALIAFTVALAWAIYYAFRIRDMNHAILVLCAAAAVSMMPLILPKMHERYFYLMDVLTFLLIFYIPRFWPFAVGAQLVSTTTYYVFLVISPQTPPPSIGAAYLMMAALINTILVFIFLKNQYRFIVAQNIGSESRQLNIQAEIPD